MKYLLAILCFTALLNPTNAQNIDKKTIIWGETDLLDRRMSTYPSEPNAEAIVLDAVIRVRMEIRDGRPQMTVQVHRRIKLLNENAVATLSKISLPIDIPANRLQMRDMRAQLIDVSDDRQSIPLEELKEGNSQYLIFSQLKSGLLLEYRYEFTTDSIAPLSNWSFQENLPVRRSELWATISPAFDYTPTFLNKEKINTFADAKSTAKVFVATDIPPTRIKTSSLMTSDYPTAVRFQINSVTPIGGNKQVYTATWRDLAQNLYKNEQIGAQYLQKSNYDQIWKAMYPSVSAAKTEEEKVKTIYNFINKNVEWNGSWSIYTTESLNKAFENRAANSAELNLMLVACLNSAGIRALPMFVSTREHGKVNVTAAAAGQFNHLICYTESNGAPRFLDASDSYRPVGMLRTESLNGDGWLLDRENPQWVKIVPTLSVRQTLSGFALSSEGDLRGRFSKTSKGYETVAERNDQSRKNTTRLLQREYQGIRIDSVTTFNLDANLNNPFKRNFYCVIPQAIEAVDSRMKIHPLWRTGLEDNILSSQRPCPIDFAYPINDLHVFNLSIPKGATVDKLPKDEAFELVDKSAAYQFTAVQSGDLVQLTIKVQVDRLHFEPSEYTKIKELFDKIAAKQAELVVLKNVKAEPLSSRR